MNLSTLRDEYTTLHTAANAALEKFVTEKRDPTAEEQTEHDKQFSRMKQIKQQMDKAQELASIAFNDKAENVELPKEIPGRAEKEQVEIKIGHTFDAKTFDRKEFAKALNKWAITGDMPSKFATITSATASGVLLPTDVESVIVPSAPNTIREALAIYDLESFKTPGTETINLPVADATAGGVVAETANSETENEPAFTETIALPVSTYQSGSSWFSNKELMAVNFDLMSATLPALAYSKELGLESNIFSTMIADGGITQSVATATVSGYTYANLVSLNRALPKKFNGMKFIVLGKNAYTAAENLTTTTGYPILNALDSQNSSLKYFNGTPVLWSDYLSGFGANNVVGLIISHMGFRLRDCGQDQVQRYTQYPGRPAQTGFNLYGFHSFGYADTAVAKLTCPAS